VVSFTLRPLYSQGECPRRKLMVDIVEKTMLPYCRSRDIDTIPTELLWPRTDCTSCQRKLAAATRDGSRARAVERRSISRAPQCDKARVHSTVNDIDVTHMRGRCVTRWSEARSIWLARVACRAAGHSVVTPHGGVRRGLAPRVLNNWVTTLKNGCASQSAHYTD
jgi:hypothetical protein